LAIDLSSGFRVIVFGLGVEVKLAVAASPLRLRLKGRAIHKLEELIKFCCGEAAVFNHPQSLFTHET
jgi:hypothetical protein